MQLAVLPRLRRPLKSELPPDPLREHIAKAIELRAIRMVDPARIEAMAEDLRLVHKKRVHHAGLVVCAVILSAFQRSTDTQGRWLDAQRVYEAIGGARSSKTSFRDQVVKLVPVMEALLRRRFDEVTAKASRKHLRGRLAAFADVLVPDGCGFKLASALSGVFAGTGTAAQLKLHAVYSLAAGDCTSVKSTAGSVHDNVEFAPQWEENALYISDLGYVDNVRFIDAIEASAHMLQRLKDDANPIVLASYGATGARRDLLSETGKPLRLKEACEFGDVHHKRVLDLDVQLADRRRRKATARVVCVPFGGQDRYYLTTLPRDVFTPHDVAELYRLRWEVELLFRGWKGALRLDEVARLRKEASLNAAVAASLLAAALSHDIAEEIDRLTNDGIDTAPQGASPPSAAATDAAKEARRPNVLRDRAATRPRVSPHPTPSPRGSGR